MSEVNRRPQHKPCAACGKPGIPELFYWYKYTTTQGKESVRRDSRCKECAREIRRDSYAKDPEKAKASSNAWKARNKEQMLARQAEYKKAAGKAICNASNAKRQAALLQRLPDWADLNAIQAIYDQATSAGLTVDHIIPLQGARVSGLHVPHNLQLLSKAENSSKKNVFAVL